MRPGEEPATLGLFSQFKTAPVSQEIVDAAAEIYRRWNPSHGMDVNDAILAATVRATGGKLYCLNTRHYPLEDILVERAWTP
jgi:predicted nucleic acid-binding protein